MMKPVVVKDCQFPICMSVSESGSIIRTRDASASKNCPVRSVKGADTVLREGVKKTIESAIMLIPGGGRSAGGDHTHLGCFSNAPNLVV